jgi:adenine C2-methylase RlmN of 23S rRNA A2503 and tRNA A37
MHVKRLLTDVRIFHLAAHRVTISTVGVVPRLKQLKQDAPHISLALSLHAPTQKIRLEIVPTAKVHFLIKNDKYCVFFSFRFGL